MKTTLHILFCLCAGTVHAQKIRFTDTSNHWYEAYYISDWHPPVLKCYPGLRPNTTTCYSDKRLGPDTVISGQHWFKGKMLIP